MARHSSGSDYEAFHDYDRALLTAGDYILTVDLDGTATGDLPFQLLTQAAATAIEANTDQSNTLSSPYGAQLYRLTLNAGDKVYMDGQSTDGGLVNWRLMDAFGLRVKSSDLMSAIPSFTVTTTGEYWLVVEGAETNSSNSTINYRFALNVVPDVIQTLVLDVATTGEITRAGQAQVYEFDLARAEALDLTPDLGFSGLTWLLEGPRGVEVASHDWSAFTATYLPEGHYRLTVSTTNGATGSYHLQVSPSSQQTTQPTLPSGDALTLNNTIADILPDTDEASHVYRFSLNTDAVLLMDVLAYSNARWRLVGPRGTEVNEYYFSNTDAPYGYNRDILRLPAGDYALTVMGSANEAYSFQLVDVASLPELTLGQTVSSVRSPASSSVGYQFDASAGQCLVFDANSTLDQTWLLIDQYGQIIPMSYGDVGSFYSITRTGRYALINEGYYYATGTGSNNLSLTPQVIIQEPLRFNDQMTGQLQTTNDRMQYQFDVLDSETVIFDALNIASGHLYDLQWQLTGPRGVVSSWQSFAYDQASFNALLAGHYTLSIRNTLNNTPLDFAFRVLTRQAASTLELGVAQQLTIPLGETGLYRFNGTARQQLYFDGQNSYSAYRSWYLLDAYGRQVASSYTVYDAHLLLPVTGEYLLVLSPTNSDSQSDVLFTLWPKTVHATALVLNTPIASTITEPASIYRYSFTLDATKSVYFAAELNALANNLQWSLRNAQGAIVSERSFLDSSANVLNLNAGDYELTVAANGLQTGDFSFQLRDVAQAPQLLSNAPTTVTLAPEQRQQVYRVNIADTADFMLSALNQDYANTDWRLVNRRGQTVQLGSFNGDSAIFSLAAGQYTLIVEAHSNVNAADASAEMVWRQISTVQQPITLNQTLQGQITEVGQRHQYTFSTTGAFKQTAEK